MAYFVLLMFRFFLFNLISIVSSIQNLPFIFYFNDFTKVPTRLTPISLHSLCFFFSSIQRVQITCQYALPTTIPLLRYLHLNFCCHFCFEQSLT